MTFKQEWKISGDLDKEGNRFVQYFSFYYTELNPFVKKVWLCKLDCSNMHGFVLLSSGNASSLLTIPPASYLPHFISLKSGAPSRSIQFRKKILRAFFSAICCLLLLLLLLLLFSFLPETWQPTEWLLRIPRGIDTNLRDRSTHSSSRAERGMSPTSSPKAAP